MKYYQVSIRYERRVDEYLRILLKSIKRRYERKQVRKIFHPRRRGFGRRFLGCHGIVVGLEIRKGWRFVWTGANTHARTPAVHKFDNFLSLSSGFARRVIYLWNLVYYVRDRYDPPSKQCCDVNKRGSPCKMGRLKTGTPPKSGGHMNEYLNTPASLFLPSPPY